MTRRMKGFTEHLAGRSKKPAAAPAPAEPVRKPARKPAPADEAGDERGGPKGPEPTRYGDWEAKGRCIDF